MDDLVIVLVWCAAIGVFLLSWFMLSDQYTDSSTDLFVKSIYELTTLSTSLICVITDR